MLVSYSLDVIMYIVGISPLTSPLREYQGYSAVSKIAEQHVTERIIREVRFQGVFILSLIYLTNREYIYKINMPAPLKRSGLQNEVISFYRQCLRAAREKPLVKVIICYALIETSNIAS